MMNSKNSAVELSRTDQALEVIKHRLGARIAAFLNACVRCGLCADTCHFHLADRETDSIPAVKVDTLNRFYRRYHTLLGRLFPAFVGAKDLTPAELKKMTDSVFGRCTMCGRCSLSCAVGLDPSSVIMFARSVLVEAGLVPKGIQANVDNYLNSGNSMSISTEDVIDTVQWLEEDLRETIADPAAEMPINRKGSRILYSINSREVKFFPLSISAAGMIFHLAGEDWTLTSTDFDVTNYGYFACDDQSAGDIEGKLFKRAEELDVEELVLAECGHGFRSTRWEAAEYFGKALPVPTRSILELIVEYIKNGRIKLDAGLNKERVTLHDPCNLVRHGGIVEEPRFILRHAVSDFVEMTPNREHNYCCGGGGGLLSASEYKNKRIESGKIKADQIRKTGAKIVAAPCHNCIDQLLELNKEYKLGVEIKTISELVADALIIPESE